LYSTVSTLKPIVGIVVTIWHGRAMGSRRRRRRRISGTKR
jgi:hypothetical protein